MGQQGRAAVAACAAGAVIWLLGGPGVVADGIARRLLVTPLASLVDPGVPATVVGVVDGGAIEVEVRGQRETVRYAGIAVPGATRQPSCWASEAEALNRSLVLGREVRLERDVRDRDGTGRKLRFVWLPDGRLVNEVLVQESAATAWPQGRYSRYQGRLADAEAGARRAGRGLWGACRALLGEERKER